MSKYLTTLVEHMNMPSLLSHFVACTRKFRVHSIMQKYAKTLVTLNHITTQSRLLGKVNERNYCTPDIKNMNKVLQHILCFICSHPTAVLLLSPSLSLSLSLSLSISHPFRCACGRPGSNKTDNEARPLNNSKTFALTYSVLYNTVRLH